MSRFPRAKFCQGVGPSQSPYLLVGESPGPMENKIGRPFVGPTGQHLNMYFFKCGLPPREEWRVENLVRYWPGPDPGQVEQEDVDRDAHYLEEAIKECEPEFVVTTGGWSSRYLLGRQTDLDRVHGIPHRPKDRSFVVIPVYHPAATLHNPIFSPKCFDDFRSVAATIQGKLKPWSPTKVKPNYQERTRKDGTTFGVIGADTEFEPDGTPYCLSLSDRFGEGEVVYYDPNDKGLPNRFAFSKIVLHHALADLPILRKMGIKIPEGKLVDTRELAYVLETLPQGLKALAYRLLNLEMQDFEDVVRPYSFKKAIKYLTMATSIEWPTPEPRLRMEKGHYKEYNPQPVHKRLSRVLTDLEKNPSLDIWARWDNLEQDEKLMVEEGLCKPFPQINVKDAPRAVVTRYAAEDASATIGIYQKLWDLVKAKGLESIIETDMAVLPMAERMMANGWLLDLEYLDTLGEELDGRLAEVSHQVAKEFNGGKSINLRSADQTRQLLYGRLGLKATKKTKGGKASTGKKQLQQLAQKSPKVIGLTNQYRELSKLKTDYCVKAKTWVDDKRKVHTVIQPFTAVSGRWTTRDPALQNIPVRTAEGLRIRKAFIAAKGCLIQLEDLDQIEMRVMAHMSGDKNLIKLFVQGRDIHSENASLLFGVPLKKVDKVLHRYPAKQAGFGILYGIQGVGLLDQMYLRGIYDYDEDDMERIISDWLKLYPGVKAFIQDVRARVRRTGYVTCMGGRRRSLPNVWSQVEWVREEALRQAVSHTISATAQWVMKRAMARVWRWLNEYVWPNNHHCEPLLQIHDELDYEVSEKFAAEAATTKVKLMCEDPLLLSGPLKFKVPIKAKSAQGVSWGACEK